MPVVACRDWPGGAGAPPLAAGGVHAWRVLLDAGGKAAAGREDSLTADEWARAAALAPAARPPFTAGRAALREILGAYLGLPAAAVAFAYGPSDKPALAGSVGPQFSVSHADGLLLVAVGAVAALGVDVERVRPVANMERIAGRFFTAREHAALLALAPAARQEAFFRAWTRKEACSKALGGDLVPALGHFEVSLAPGGPPRLLAVGGDPLAAAGWTLSDIDAGPEYVAALAVKE